MGKESSDVCWSFLGRVRSSNACRTLRWVGKHSGCWMHEIWSSHFPLAEQKEYAVWLTVVLRFHVSHIGHQIRRCFLKLWRYRGLFWASATAGSMTRRLFLIHCKHDHIIWSWKWQLILPSTITSKNIYHFISIFLGIKHGSCCHQIKRKRSRLMFKFWQFYDIDVLCKKKSVLYSNTSFLIVDDFDSLQYAQPLELRILSIQ